MTAVAERATVPEQTDDKLATFASPRGTPPELIKLTEGLTLVVSAEFANDTDTLCFVERIKVLFDREANVRNIKDELRWLLAGEELEGLEIVAETAGWSPAKPTCASLVRGIEAVLPILSDAGIVEVNDQADFYGTNVRARARGVSEAEFDRLSDIVYPQRVEARS